MAACQTRRKLVSCHGSQNSTTEARAHGIMFSKPLVPLLTPNPFTSVGIQ